MEPETHDTIADQSPMDGAEHLFQLVCCEPYGLALDGASLAAELPQRRITLVELRQLLTSRELSNATRDVVWRELVQRARLLGAVWLVGAVGVALPALRGIAGRITSGYFAGDPVDLDNEVLTAFIDAVRTIGLDGPNVRPRLCDMAKSAGKRARKRAESGVCHRLPMNISKPPPDPWGHPDFVLFDAVAKGVVSELDAELIGRTRLEGMPLQQAADQLGLTEAAARKRRQRSEPVLAAAVLAGEVRACMSLTITSPAPRRAGAHSSARSRISSDANSDHIDSKGGMGNLSGSARIPSAQTAGGSNVAPSLAPRKAKPPPSARRAEDAPALFPSPAQLPARSPRGPRKRLLRLLAIAAIAAVVIAAVATEALAATGTRVGPPTSPDQLGRVFDNLRNWLIGLLATLATLMLTIGGLRYLIAGGDPGEVQKAKAALKAAALGYALAVLAPLFVNVLKRVVGG